MIQCLPFAIIMPLKWLGMYLRIYRSKGAVVVAQMTEWFIANPEVPGSKSDNGKCIYVLAVNFTGRLQLPMKKRSGMAHFSQTKLLNWSVKKALSFLFIYPSFICYTKRNLSNRIEIKMLFCSEKYVSVIFFVTTTIAFLPFFVSTSVTRFGFFFKALGKNFITNISPNICWYFGLFLENITFSVKAAVATSWAIFEKSGQLYSFKKGLENSD